MSDAIGYTLLGGLTLLLPLSALAARRLALRSIMLMALVWVAIFAAAILVVAERERFAEIGADLRLELDPEAGQRRGRTVRIPLGEDGHYWVRAEVNGVAMRFLVDSGATVTALGTASAERAGVTPDNDHASGMAVPIATANGVVSARRVTLARLDVAGIERRDFAAVVALEFGDANVLGMNFLSSLDEWSVTRGTLTLVP